MTNRALVLAFGGYADLDLTFGEFFADDHTVMLRFMPQHPYAGPGPLLTEIGSGTYVIALGGFKSSSADPAVAGPTTLFLEVGAVRVTYNVPGLTHDVGGPAGYRGVWQHLAVVRHGQTMRLYLNGGLLEGIEAANLSIPTSGLPGKGASLRIGRFSSGTDDDHVFSQFYGLIDDVAVYTAALDPDEIEQAAATHLAGDERALLAGWTFDTGLLPGSLARPVQLPAASDIPEHVNVHAAHPLPAYLTTVSPNRDSAQDGTKMDIRPSKVRTELPFGAGEWWKIGQGWEDPRLTKSHRGKAAFCTDLSRVNGQTFGNPVFAAAPARVIFANELAGEEPGEEAMSVYHAPFERAVYMHLTTGFFSKYFPGAEGLPQDQSIADQPTSTYRQPIADVGHHPNGDHLHFATSSISGEVFAGAGPSQPNALANYYASTDQGKSWTKVDLGIPAPGDWVAHYPWSPWGEKGDPLTVSPAVASRGPNRLDVFARGENNHLWHKRWNGQEWGDWEDLGGGRLTSAPAAVSWGPNRIDVFVRGFDHQLAQKRWNGQEWSEWRNLGGRLTSAPAVASWGPDRLDVFVRGHDGQLAQKRWNGEEWSEWRNLGGRLTSAPAAVSWGPNRVDVFVRGFENQLAQKRWTDDQGWSEWRNLGGRLTSAPAVASWGRFRLDVFVRGHEGQLAQKRWDGQEWSEWRNLGGRLTSAPAAVSWGANRIDVFVRGFEHQLAQKRWTDDQGWSEWRDLDQ